MQRSQTKVIWCFADGSNQRSHRNESFKRVRANDDWVAFERGRWAGNGLTRWIAPYLLDITNEDVAIHTHIYICIEGSKPVNEVSRGGELYTERRRRRRAKLLQEASSGSGRKGSAFVVPPIATAVNNDGRTLLSRWRETLFSA